MKKRKQLKYFNTTLTAIIAIALICFFCMISQIFTKRVSKNNVFINFKADNKSTYGVFINDSLVITSEQIRKLVSEGFYKQTKFNLHLKNGQYKMAIKDSLDQIIVTESFEIKNLDERYFYLYIDKGEIEIKDEPYILL